MVAEQNIALEQFLEESGVLARTRIVALMQLEMQRPDTAYGDMLSELEKDEPLLKSIVAVATSARFGGHAHHCSARDALNRLGVEEFHRQLITSVVHTNLVESPPPDFLKHAEVVGRLCEQMAAKCLPELAVTAYFTGLYHDAGVPVMQRNLTDYDYFADQAIGNDPGVLELERECHEFHHGEVAAQLVEHMDLPSVMIDAIRHHHEPERLAALDGDAAPLLAFVLLAERVIQISRQEIASVFLGASEKPLEESICAVLGQSHEDLQRIAEEMVRNCSIRLRQPM